ncbi:unnamed protein product, partial [Heterosigma akashiwo]
MTCTSCQRTYCFYHSNAHEGSDCTRYELKLTKESAALRVDNQLTKPCPSCGAATIKGGGCNQMKCAYCEKYFCWLCLKIVDGGTFPAHFQWWNINGCANMQLQESAEDPSPAAKKVMKIISFLQVVLFAPVAAIMTAVSAFTCCCIFFVVDGTKRQRVEGVFSCWGNVCMCALGVPFMLVTAPLWLPLACLWLCASGAAAGVRGGDKEGQSLEGRLGISLNSIERLAALQGPEKTKGVDNKEQVSEQPSAKADDLELQQKVVEIQE